MTRLSDEKRERYLEEMGLGPVWRLRGRVAEAPEPAAPAPAKVAPPRPAPRRPPPVPGLSAAVKVDLADDRAARILKMEWPELKSAVQSCTACGLRKTCTQTVFGVGDEQADWLLVGEAPGSEEDARGEPFVGRKYVFAERGPHGGDGSMKPDILAATFDLAPCVRSDRFKLIYNCTPHGAASPVDSRGDPGW